MDQNKTKSTLAYGEEQGSQQGKHRHISQTHAYIFYGIFSMHMQPHTALLTAAARPEKSFLSHTAL